MNHEQIRPPNSVDSTSKSLLKRIKQGDEIAWQQLANLYGPIISFWIKEHQLAHEDAQDVYQEVFSAVAKNIERFERHEGAGKFRCWLKVITQSKVTNHFRRSSAERAVGGTTEIRNLDEIADPEVDDNEIDGAPDLTETENAAIVQGVIRLIQDEFRESTWQSFWLTAIDGKSAVEVAAELALTSEAVRKNKSRVLARLREALAEHMS